MSGPDSEPGGAPGADPTVADDAPTGAPAEDTAGDDQHPTDQASTSGGAPAVVRRNRRRSASALATGALAVVLGFALTVQVRANDEVPGDQVVTREDDLVTILDDLDSQEEELRQQIAERRQTLEELGSGQQQRGRALTEAQERAEAIAVLNGSVPASGPGLRVTIEDPEGAVTAGILLDAIQELRGAGAEAIQVDGVRIVVSSYVDGDPGELVIDGQPISAPYDLRAVGPSDDLTVALNVSGGVVADVARFGGTARVTQTDDVVVDAIRPPTGE
jgi:uncharacterized protein YlxW (UPF0749 family)